MSVMTEERQGQAAPAAIRRPASGIAIDPARLAWWRESRGWSRQDLSDEVARLDLTDENGEELTVTRDAIAKIENGERKPKARTVRGLCLALSVPGDECTPRDLLPGGDPLTPHAGAEERKLRLAHNKDLRTFARAHGIQYRNPVSGRVYYSVPLEEAFAASVAGYDNETLASLVAAARGSAPEAGGQPGNGITAADGIEELDLSVRTHNTLVRAGIRTIADLTRVGAGELTGLKGFGASSLGELREKLTAAGFALAEPEPAPEPVPEPAPEPVPEPAARHPEPAPDEDVRHVLAGLAGTDSIANLRLSARSLNMLLRQGVGTIGELAGLTLPQLGDIPNLGAKSVREIRDRLAAAGFALAGEGADSRDPELLAS